MARVSLNPSPCVDPFPVPNPVSLRTLRSAGNLFLAAAALAGCHTDRKVAVRVSIPDADSRETPAAGVGVIALPYDRDSVLASLEARARTPRPSTAALDTLFAGFRGPFAHYTKLSYLAGQLRDTVEQQGERADPKLRDSLLSLERQVTHARSELDRARTHFLSRSEPLRTAIQQWQDSTYRGWDSIVERLTRSSGRDAVTDTTDQTGWAHFSLGPGHWWLYATAWDTGDPNAVWYWNVPVDDDTLLLSSRTGRRKPRY